MVYSVHFTNEGREILHRLHIGVQQRIKTAVKGLAENPYLGEPLKEGLQGFHSLHVTKYRVIYSIEGDKVIIHYVGHHRDAYTTFQEVVDNDTN